MEKIGGYKTINRDLLAALNDIDLLGNAKLLGLACNAAGQIEIKFLGKDYLVEPGVIRSVDGKIPGLHHGSVIAGYILKKGCGEPAGKFVPLSRLTGMVAGRSSFNKSVLESRLAKAAGRNTKGFEKAIYELGGKEEGKVDDGGRGWIIRLLPKIPAQLIAYEEDEEFPFEIRLLFDITATNFLEFEFLAFMAAIFVEDLIAAIKTYN